MRREMERRVTWSAVSRVRKEGVRMASMSERVTKAFVVDERASMHCGELTGQLCCGAGSVNAPLRIRERWRRPCRSIQLAGL